MHNCVIAAESLGLGSVYVGMILSQNLQESLGVPEYVIPAGLVTIGVPDEEPEVRPRLPLEAVVHRNEYHIPTDDEIAEWYREGDEAWQRAFENEWSAEYRAKLVELGVDNRAKNWTIGHYTEEFTKRESAGVIENLQRAGFRLARTDS